jgi:L,D-peptidoglycan transpeptidase YkuD (ErfK/YbiS/YcfS/YnhG family)
VKRSLKTLHVFVIAMAATRGILVAGGLQVPCRLGRSGVRILKREGDGATPAGRFRLERLLYRADRLRPPPTGLPSRPIRPNDGWCEVPLDRNYNRPVSLPYPASHETMARADGLYDLVVILSHNRRPRVQGLGSAIFFHLTETGRGPTAGCVAVTRAAMMKILPLCGPETRIAIAVPPRPLFRKSPSPPARGWRSKR